MYSQPCSPCPPKMGTRWNIVGASSNKGDNMAKIDFKITPKVTYITSDIPDYEDFKSNWEEWHEADEPCPEDNSREYWELVSDEQAMNWDDFRSNFNHGHLIGKTCLFRGGYSSR